MPGYRVPAHRPSGCPSRSPSGWATPSSTAFTSRARAFRSRRSRTTVQGQPRPGARGAQVTRLELDEVNDVFEVRISLLGLAARLAAERRDPELIRFLRRAVDELQALSRSSDADRSTPAPSIAST